jgi:hypothetical protein
MVCFAGHQAFAEKVGKNPFAKGHALFFRPLCFLPKKSGKTPRPFRRKISEKPPIFTPKHRKNLLQNNHVS